MAEPEDMQEDIIEGANDNLGKLPSVNLSELGTSLTKKPELSFNRTQSQAPLQQPEYSVLAAGFFKDTTIGSILQRPKATNFNPEVDQGLSFVSLVPERHMNRWHLYALATNKDEALDIMASIDREDQDNATLAASPWKSFFYAFATQPLDPVNYIPGTVIFNNAKRLSNTAKAALYAASAGLISTAAQETLISSNQLTREIDESVFNVLAAGTLSATLGGGLTRFSPQIKRYTAASRNFARAELLDMYVGTAKKLSPDGILDANAISKMPKFVQKAMINSTMNKMLASDFDAPKNVAADLYEHGYVLNKNLQGVATTNVETNIKLDLRQMAPILIEYQNIFFDQAGVKPGFGASRAANKRASLDPTGAILNFDAFEKAVGYTIFTKEPHASPAVNKAAKLLNERVFDLYSKAANELGLMPEGMSPKNAAAYFMVDWNTQKIKENQGGFESLNRDWFGKINSVVKRIRESKEFKELSLEIKELKEKLRPKDKSKKRPSADETRVLGENIKVKEEKLKSFSDKMAERYLLPDERAAIYHTQGPRKNKLRKVLSLSQIEANIEQTIDRILGKDGSKIRGDVIRSLDGKPSQLKERSHLIPQRLAWDWMNQSPSSVVANYTHQMAPAIRMSEMARQNGFNSIGDWYQGMLKDLRAELKVKKEGKVGLKAAKLERAFDAQAKNIKDSFKQKKIF
jgi:hypothetical protein